MERRRLGRRAPLDLDGVTYGIHAVSEALAAGERLRRIHVADQRRRDPALRTLLAAADESGITVRFESRGFFAQFPYKAHQGVIAFAQPFDYLTLDEALARRKPASPALFVVLDHITDPHNAGAIIRTAEAAAADALVLPERRSAGVNATVRKASAGATAHLSIARVGNVAGALREMKAAGLWIAGADLSAGALPYTQADLTVDLALVIGAEGAGLSTVTRKECDYLLTVPTAGHVGSLNASVAAGILLFEVRRQRGSVSC
ncbi:MAG: 23S rRNA (guanosine(2251)-2'-O)-methyltransferase RlmB [Candidatus Eremiobacteraeota bacterium]|nr:23S rRNA (guanosine(2251)-2'-O)-methyltransferase RlmB [Candidatus Eremiobacteraeota bacterium]MBV8355423.1 23S rRNA (guanosine(2251)-2'-O)-methyltransferase RlmB [Candidatus Eremiobacteraeota bacterium]